MNCCIQGGSVDDAGLLLLAKMLAVWSLGLEPIEEFLIANLVRIDAQTFTDAYRHKAFGSGSRLLHASTTRLLIPTAPNSSTFSTMCAVYFAARSSVVYMMPTAFGMPASKIASVQRAWPLLVPVSLT